MNLHATCASKNTFIRTMTLPSLPSPVPMKVRVLDARGRGLLQAVETQPSTPTSTSSNMTSCLYNLLKYKITYPRKNALPSLTFENVQTVIIKPADKGSGTVIMDSSWYINECYTLLNDPIHYQKQSTNLTNKIRERVKEYLDRLHQDDLIDDDTFKYLTSNPNPKAGRFYMLPKIHKQGNPGRPIISSNGHPTERISEFVNHHLKSLAQPLPSYIKDTTHFFLHLEQMGPLPDNAILVTLDVSSLYTNIPHNEGIEACHHFLNTRQDKTLPTERICDLIRMILA